MATRRRPSQPDAARGGRHVRGDRGGLRCRGQDPAPAGPARAGRPADRQGHRQGRRWRAAHRPARGPRRRGHRQGLRSTARRGQVGRDADGRHRPPGHPRPRRPTRRGRAGALPPAQVHARLAGRGRRRDRPTAGRRGLGGGQVRRHPRPAAQARVGRPALQPRPARRQQPVPGGGRGRARPATGTASWTARSWASRTASSCRSSTSRPGSGASGRRRRSWRTSRSSTSPSTRWRSGTGDDELGAAHGGAAPAHAAARATGAPRRHRPARRAASSARSWPSPTTRTSWRRPSPRPAPGATRG